MENNPKDNGLEDIQIEDSKNIEANNIDKDIFNNTQANIIEDVNVEQAEHTQSSHVSGCDSCGGCSKNASSFEQSQDTKNNSDNNNIDSNKNDDNSNNSSHTLKVVGIKFKSSSKVYSFDPCDLDLKKEQLVVVQTVKGVEFATVAVEPKLTVFDNKVLPLKPVLRIASDEDKAKFEQNTIEAKQARIKGNELVEKHGLKMKIIDAEYTFDKSKLAFYFTAESRVDFRELLKDFAKQFRVFIDLRQVAEHEQAKKHVVVGCCGRPCCCSMGIEKYATIKMAKNQNLSLNAQHIQGMCGKYKCCLEFENDHYTQVNKRCPKVGSMCCDSQGNCGKLVSINYLKETGTLRVQDENTIDFVDVPVDELKKS